MKHAKKQGMKHAKSNPKKTVGIVVICVLAILAVAYVAGVVFFSSHFLPGAKVAGIDMSFKDRAEATALVNEKAKSYTCHVSGCEFSLDIPGDKISYSFDTEKALDNAEAAGNPFMWFLGENAIEKKSPTSESELCAKYDADALKAIVSPALETHNATATKPANAKLVYDEPTNKVIVAKESYGTLLDAGKTSTAICEGLEEMSDVALGQNQLTAPEIDENNAELLAKADALNASGMKIPDLKLTMGDAEVGAVDADTIVNWFTVGSDGTATFDESKMNQWVSDFASTHTTLGKERTYTRADGKVITVPASNYSAYGWQVNESELLELVKNALKNGERGTVAVPCSSEAATYVEGGRDWGKRYLDVDISEQYVRYYGDDGSIIWEASCISGEENTSKATPLGVNVLFEKKSPMVLIGHEGNVEIYRTNVSYWMKFMACGVGFHDATWQTQGFGGSWFRQGYGSHGCINLSYANAESLYAICQIGDVVVTHY